MDEELIIKRKKSLKTMYWGISLYVVFMLLCILTSGHIWAGAFLLIPVVGGIMGLLTLLVGRFPYVCGIITALLSIQPIIIGLLAVSAIFDSITTFFLGLAYLSGGVLMFIGTLRIVWLTSRIKNTVPALN